MKDASPPPRLRAAFWGAVVVLGLIHVVASGHAMRSDTISYLDMADAAAQGHWKALLNLLWSPLYPLLLSLALRLAKPSAWWEFTLVHVVDLLIFFVAAACFGYFLRALVRYAGRRAAALAPDEATLPARCWWLLGYTLFLWSSLVQILRIPGGTPDLCVAALVYLAAALILRLRCGDSGWRVFAALGAVLGLGYWAKAAMFPLASVFLAVAFAAPRERHAAPRALLALAVFALFAAPLVCGLSHRAGRLTFGDAGRLNYAWMVNRVTRYVHWQGGPPGNGTPLHPTRQVLDSPPVFEFAAPVGGTYPPWLDPAYWHEGLMPRFRLGEQLRTLAANAKVYFSLLLRQGSLVAMLVMLLTLSRRRWRCLRDLAAPWPLLLPATAALGMYALVYFESRYIGPFLVLLWAGLFLAVRRPAGPESEATAAAATLAVVAVLLLEVGAVLLQELYDQAGTPRGHPQAQIASALYGLGVRPGDHVGFIGWGSDAYWARVARVKIVAELPRYAAGEFWEGAPEARRRALAAFASTGVRAVVAEKAPAAAAADGWKPLPAGHWVCRLSDPAAGSRQAASGAVLYCQN
jgi:hypothetical protein